MRRRLARCRHNRTARACLTSAPDKKVAVSRLSAISHRNPAPFSATSHQASARLISRFFRACKASNEAGRLVAAIIKITNFQGDFDHE